MTANDIKAEAERDATSLLRTTWPLGIPVDPIAIARRSGLRVLDAPLDEDTIGALIKRPFDEPTIMINQSDHENRKRFTCAHELGHFVRRSEEADEYSTLDLRSKQSSTGTDPEEVYANEFAACLLMPSDGIRSYLDMGLTDLEMAIRFRVSREAMQHRLRNLGLARH
jgi:Zn-dependent peptidase ImmA (M78 family)